MTFEGMVFVDAKLTNDVNELLKPAFKKLWELVVEHDPSPPHRIWVTDARGYKFLEFAYQLDNHGIPSHRGVRSETEDFVPKLPVTIRLQDCSGTRSVKVTIEPYSATELIQ